MSSSFGSSGSIGPAHDAYRLVIEPHVQIAIWALMAAVAVAMVMIVVDMIKERGGDATPARKKIPPKKPDNRN